jgi:hypothetical protein
MTDPIALWWDGQREFCANPACLLHVRADSAAVRGAGQWATLDGVVYDRHPMEVGGPLYCMACRKRLAATLAETARLAMPASAGHGAA